MKGYTHRMGRVVTTMEAHLRVCEVGACCTSSMVTPISSSAAVAEMMMVRITFCTGTSLASVRYITPGNHAFQKETA